MKRDNYILIPEPLVIIIIIIDYCVQVGSTAGLDTRMHPIQRVVLMGTFGGCILIYSNCTSLRWVDDDGGGLVQYKSCFGPYLFNATCCMFVSLPLEQYSSTAFSCLIFASDAQTAPHD